MHYARLPKQVSRRSGHEFYPFHIEFGNAGGHRRQPRDIFGPPSADVGTGGDSAQLGPTDRIPF